MLAGHHERSRDTKYEATKNINKTIGLRGRCYSPRDFGRRRNQGFAFIPFETLEAASTCERVAGRQTKYVTTQGNPFHLQLCASPPSWHEIHCQQERLVLPDARTD